MKWLRRLKAFILVLTALLEAYILVDRCTDKLADRLIEFGEAWG